jgi:hypothetical protein
MNLKLNEKYHVRMGRGGMMISGGALYPEEHKGHLVEVTKIYEHCNTGWPQYIPEVDVKCITCNYESATFNSQFLEPANPLDRLDIRENLSDGDTLALKQITQVVLLWRIHGVRIVEVGSWKGWSTQLMASLIKPHGGEIFAVDNWRGSADDWNVKAAREQDIFSIFRYNMRELNLMDVIHPLVMDSVKAAEIFKDDSVDMVFIDANHRLKNTREDILNWMPKIQAPGIICGHDCEGYYSEFPVVKQKIIDMATNTDVIKGIGHPGVIKALYEVFDDKYSRMPGSRIWYYLKL